MPINHAESKQSKPIIWVTFLREAIRGVNVPRRLTTKERARRYRQGEVTENPEMEILFAGNFIVTAGMAPESALT